MEQYFEKYVESDSGKQKLENLMKDSITYDNYTEMLVEKAQASKTMEKVQKDWLAEVITKKTGLTLLKLNDWLSSYIVKLVFLPGVDMDAIPAVKKFYLRISHQTRLAIHSEHSFRFYWNDQKFNWDSFEFYLQAVSDQEMISKIGEFSFYPPTDSI